MSSGTTPSPDARRIAAPRWLDLRLVLGVVLVLASVLIGASVVSGASDTVPVVSAVRDLAAGTVLRAQDLRTEQVQLPDDGRARYLAEVDDAVGKTLSRSVSRDELLPRAAVGTTPNRTVLTVPSAAGAAPELRTGQRITLWLSTPTCAFVVLLPDVTVQSVRSADDSSFGSSSGGGQNVVISVPPALAPRIVAAQSIENASVRAGVITGSATSTAPTATAPAAAPSGSSSGLPADLAACAGSGAR